MIVNKRQLAELFGVSEETISQWQKLGCPVRARRHGTRGNEYETAAVFAWRVARADESTASDLATEKAALARAQREKTQIEIDRLKGALVAKSDVIRSGANRGAALAAELDTLLARMAAVLDGAALAALRREVYTMRTDFGKLISEATDRAGKKP